jgi:triosephosphate isomerase
VTAAIKAIRNQIKHLYGKQAAEDITVLYGGSVTASSAADYLALPEVNGLLIGGASLDAHAFTDIIKKAHKGSAVAKSA